MFIQFSFGSCNFLSTVCISERLTISINIDFYIPVLCVFFSFLFCSVLSLARSVFAFIPWARNMAHLFSYRICETRASPIPFRLSFFNKLHVNGFVVIVVIVSSSSVALALSSPLYPLMDDVIATIVAINESTYFLQLLDHSIHFTACLLRPHNIPFDKWDSW